MMGLMFGFGYTGTDRSGDSGGYIIVELNSIFVDTAIRKM
jgi:hypothetical protein